MRPLKKLYLLRLVLGITAAFICVGYGIATGSISNVDFSLNVLLNSVSLAVVVYLISYYILKPKFTLKVEKSRKILTTGIGVYFLTWLVFWGLIYTIIAGPPPA